MGILDAYIEDYIRTGDDGSDILKRETIGTWRNSSLVDMTHDQVGVRIPEDHYVIVHSASGDVDERDPVKHAASLVDRLVDQAERIGATPIGFGNVIDSPQGDNAMLEDIASAMVARSNYHGVAILNGENAILGDLVQTRANISGTMISMIPKSEAVELGAVEHEGVTYVTFDHEGKLVTINSDGIGTKGMVHQRMGMPELSLHGAAAMLVDDSAKSGAKVMVVADVVEYSGSIPEEVMLERAREIGERLGAVYALQFENVGGRLRSYDGQAPAFNIGGSAVCLLHEERLANPLAPQEGDVLVALRNPSNPNPRSNGISARRAAAKLLGKEWAEYEGQEWHETAEGRDLMQYLGAPSEILYPFFMEAVAQGVATSVYHMSGGAYDGKLAALLAKERLFVDLEDRLFEPDRRELDLLHAAGSTIQAGYATWAMGNDGFVATRDPARAIELAEEFGYEAKVVGTLVRDGRTGVRLVYDGEVVEFDGMKKAS